MGKSLQPKGSRYSLRQLTGFTRRIVLLALGFTLLVPVAAGQNPEKKISLNVSDVTVLDALKEINRLSGANIVSFMTQEVAKEQKRVTLSLRDITIINAVDETLRGTALQALVQQNDILVVPRQQMLPAATVNYYVTGTVHDTDGNPVTGAVVTVKGTSRGVISDGEGYFRIAVQPAQPGHHSVITVSLLGYSTQEFTLSEPTTLRVILAQQVSRMSEIVVTGLQRREKSVMVGSVSSATSADLETTGVTTVDKALAGRLAGVYIRSTSGRPGETGKIQIRGINTMTGSTEPLYVLDGMPMQTGEMSGGINQLLTNGIGNIPPENIESITILKDATAAAVYGARAANGVVVIETKMGRVGKDYIAYSGKFGLTQRPHNQFDFMNSAEKLQFESELYEQFHSNYGGRAIQLLNQRDNGTISAAEMERQLDMLRNTNTDWMKVLYRNALSHSHNVTLSGGSTKTQYFASANFQSEQGTLIRNKFNTGGLTLKVSRYATDNLLVRFSLYSTYKQNKEGQSDMDPFKYASFANTYEKPYNDDGSYSADMTYRNLSNDITYYSDLNYLNFNMVRELRENTLTNSYGNMRGQIDVEWKFLKDFRYSLSAVADYTYIHNIDESQPGTYRSWSNHWLNTVSQYGKVLPEHNLGFLKEDMGRTFDYTVRNSVEYNKNIDKHYIQAYVANEVGGRQNYRFSHFNPLYLSDYRMAGYPSWALVTKDETEKLLLSRFGGSYFLEDRSVSFIGSLVYSYDNRYVFNFNARYDGVDIIGADNQFAPLWSTGAKWNVHNEDFLRGHNDILSRLVISAGFGYRGSINRSEYPFHRYLVGTNIYDGNATATELIFGNPSIKWERKQELNLGLELSLFRGRVNLEGRYFDEDIKDLLDKHMLPSSVGRTDATINVGNMTNRGLEASFRVEAVKTNHFLWEIGGNLTKVTNNLKNVYTKLPPDLPSSETQDVQGHPTNSWYGYRFSHVNPETGSMMVHAQRKEAHVSGPDVNYTYTDEIIDLSRITQKELQENYSPYYLGHRDPDLYGGFQTRLVYKQFELAANFVFAAGNRILNFQDRLNGPDVIESDDKQIKYGVDDLTASRTNREKRVINRWKQYGDVTDVPGFTSSTTNYSNYLIDTDLDKGSYLRCNDLAFTWRAAPAMLKNTFLSTLRATFVVNNLFTISPYRGIDPELQIPFGYPNTRSYTLTVNIGF